MVDCKTEIIRWDGRLWDGRLWDRYYKMVDDETDIRDGKLWDK